jgi:creatinine amidohydrolase
MIDSSHSSREVRIQFLRPGALIEERKRLPLIFLPVGPLEWHGPHMAFGMDPINAERTALELARRVGGVVHPTLYAGTERERDPATLKSLGFGAEDYVVGMDFPKYREQCGSFYCAEETFGMIVRAHIDIFIARGYRYIFIVNGHGAVNHNQALERLCIEYSRGGSAAKVGYSPAFPTEHIRIGAIGHASALETSLLLHYEPQCIDLKQLPPKGERLKYSDFGIVDGDGFCGRPGPGHTLPDHDDPRLQSSAEEGKKVFTEIVRDLEAKLKKSFEL